MKTFNILLIKLSVLFLLLAMLLPASAKQQNKKVLMVVTSYGQQQGEEKPGYEFDEFAKAYSVFKANNIDVDVASPKGGKVVADKYDENKPYNVPVLADNAIMNKLDNTIATANVNAENYDGIFIVGGKGAMFDLPKDVALQQTIASLYQAQGSIAAVCHGPAALVDVKLSNGRYLVANKKVNAFTNKEEKLFGKKWLKQFEFMLEDKLIERGAKFQSSDIMLSHVAVDGRLITGQNPTSTTDVAIELVKSLGLTPIKTQYYTDDKTMALIAKVLKNDANALNTLKTEQENYHIPLVGMYGFYYLKVAESTQHFEQALSLMLVAQKAINNPVLDMKIAKTQHKLGKNNAARATLEQVLQSTPDHQGALEMLKTLSL